MSVYMFTSLRFLSSSSSSDLVLASQLVCFFSFYPAEAVSDVSPPSASTTTTTAAAAALNGSSVCALI